MAWYRLYRGVDRRDVADAHALALQRAGPPTTYVISSATPFQREDCRGLLTNAPDVIDQRCAGLTGRAAVLGWHPPQSIDRIYDCGLASQELKYVPRFGIEACLSGNWDPSPAG
jgi:UDP-glucose 4-epimerase